jgi:hypothetical protein
VAVAVDTSNNVHLFGALSSDTNFNNQSLVCRKNDDSLITIPNTTAYVPVAMAVAPDGTVYILGRPPNSGTAYNQYWKITSDGTVSQPVSAGQSFPLQNGYFSVGMAVDSTHIYIILNPYRKFAKSL